MAVMRTQFKFVYDKFTRYNDFFYSFIIALLSYSIFIIFMFLLHMMCVCLCARVCLFILCLFIGSFVSYLVVTFVGQNKLRQTFTVHTNGHLK